MKKNVSDHSLTTCISAMHVKETISAKVEVSAFASFEDDKGIGSLAIVLYLTVAAQ